MIFRHHLVSFLRVHFGYFYIAVTGLGNNIRNADFSSAHHKTDSIPPSLLSIIIGAIISFGDIWCQACTRSHRNAKLSTTQQPSTSRQIRTIWFRGNVIADSISWHLGKRVRVGSGNSSDAGVFGNGECEAWTTRGLKSEESQKKTNIQNDPPCRDFERLPKLLSSEWRSVLSTMLAGALVIVIRVTLSWHLTRWSRSSELLRCRCSAASRLRDAALYWQPNNF